jgi:hypothetical protein
VFTCIATAFRVEFGASGAFNRGIYSVVVSDYVSLPYNDGHHRLLENIENLIPL